MEREPRVVASAAGDVVVGRAGGHAQDGVAALSFVYCLIPCALKLAAAAALWLAWPALSFTPDWKAE